MNRRIGRLAGAVVRVWRGRVPLAHACAFHRHLIATGLHDAEALPGNLGALLLRRDEPRFASFTLLTLWENEAAIHQFVSGDDLEQARLYPGDEAFELVPDLQVQHHQVVADSVSAPTGLREPRR